MSVTECHAERHRQGNRGADGLEGGAGYRGQGSECRLLRIYDVCAAREGCARFFGVTYTYEQSHAPIVAGMFSLPLRKPKVRAQVTTTSPVISLRNKTMLVTGASSGIGRAIAVAAARAGALVAITYRRNRRGAEETVQAIAAAGGKVHIFPLDLTEPGALEQLVSQLSEQFDGLDTWVNNAGADILTGEGKLLTRRQKLDAVLDVDLRGTVLASWAAVDYFRARQRSGSIINMSWDHVLTGMAGENPVIYSAAKGGIHAFSKSLAREVAPLIRVNVIAPGFIDTAFGDEASADWRAHVERVTPLGRWGTPEDVAQAAVYLASDAAAFVTGQALLVNGGVVI